MMYEKSPAAAYPDGESPLDGSDSSVLPSTLFNGTIFHPGFLRMSSAQGWIPDHSRCRNICTQTNIRGGMSVWRGLSLMSSCGITVGIVMVGGHIRLMVGAVWTPCSVTIWHLSGRAGPRFRVWILIIREIGTTFRMWVLSGGHSPSWIITPKPMLMRYIQALRWWIRAVDVGVSLVRVHRRVILTIMISMGRGKRALCAMWHSLGMMMTRSSG